MEQRLKLFILVCKYQREEINLRTLTYLLILNHCLFNLTMNEKRTIDTIIASLRETVEKKEVVHPSWWIEAAEMLNLLLGDDQDKLFGLQQEIAQQRYEILKSQTKRNVSEVNLIVESTDKFKEMRILEAKIKRIQEQIKIAKVHARLASDELSR